jgi:hypothetical protein
MECPTCHKSVTSFNYVYEYLEDGTERIVSVCVACANQLMAIRVFS